MQSHSMFVNTRKHKYVSNTAWLNEMNEYFRNYLENNPIRATPHGLALKRVVPRISWFSILLWTSGTSAAVYKVACT